MPRPPRGKRRALFLSASLLLLFVAAAVGLVPAPNDGVARGGEPVESLAASEEGTPSPEAQCPPPPDFAGPSLPAGPHILTGSVANTGLTGLEGIQVRITAIGGGHDRIDTAADGSYAYPGLGDGSYVLSFWDVTGTYQSGFLGASGLVFSQADADPVVISGGDPSSANVVLPNEQPRQISGSVTDSFAAPVFGAQMIATAPYFPLTGCGSSQPDGSYAIPDLRAGAYRVQIVDPAETFPDGFFAAGEPGNWSANIALATLVIVGGADVPDINIQLPPTFHLGGSIQDALSQPVAGVNLSACQIGGGGCGYGQTDEFGVFDISGLPAGDYRLREDALLIGFANGYYATSNPDHFVLDLDDATPISVTADVSGIDLVLPVAARVSGTVTDSLAAGLGSVSLSFTTLDQSDSGYALSNLDGSYTTSALQPGTYQISAYDTTGTHPNGYRDVTGSLVGDPALAGEVVIGLADVTGLDVEVPDGGGLDVLVTANGLPTYGYVRVCLTPTVCVADGWQTGLAAFPAVLPGSYLIGFQGSGPEWWYMDDDTAVEDPGAATLVEIVAGTTVAIEATFPGAETLMWEGEDVTFPLDVGDGTTPVQLSFDQITAGGTTTLTIPSDPPTVPSGFQLGDPPTYYDISTTATFAGLIEVCVDFVPAAYADPASISLLHFDPTPDPGAWVDITTSLDEVNGRVCGLTDSLSPFLVAESSIEFGGFFGLKVPPQVNEAKAGDRIGVQFSLVNTTDLAVLADGSPSWQQVSCATGLPIGGSQAAQAASALKYNAYTGRYTFSWQTVKAWKGTCRLLTLTFIGGTSADLLYRFK